MELNRYLKRARTCARKEIMCDAYLSSNLAIMPEDAIAAILEFASGRDLAAIQAVGSKAIHRLVDDGARRRLDALAGDVASNEWVPNDALAQLEEHEPRCWAPADALAQLEEHEPRCWAPADAAALLALLRAQRSGDWIALDGFVRYASDDFACGRIMGKHLRLFSRPSGACSRRRRRAARSSPAAPSSSGASSRARSARTGATCSSSTAASARSAVRRRACSSSRCEGAVLAQVEGHERVGSRTRVALRAWAAKE
ncbi:hypothetical protein SO694_00004674 [Aureococcus anophagefferens]|uniref:F-box domain-containing protein n=1 Tax=Aureococcus anophagefferens TaxID=44056 RepID=A0ABR1G9C2_AURAN